MVACLFSCLGGKHVLPYLVIALSVKSWFTCSIEHCTLLLIMGSCFVCVRSPSLHPSIISGPVLEAQSEDIHAQEGEEVAMWIQVDGDPTPQVTWTHNGKLVYIEDDIEEEEYNDDSQLVLHSVQASHAGVYQFEATNTWGTIDGRIRLFVETSAVSHSDVCDNTNVKLSVKSNPIPLPKLVEYIAEIQPHNYRELREQYRVSTSS